jgi:poly-beta-hydroxybutyrate-responsive repressor
VRGFIQPWLLLLLARQAAHGYHLMDRLRSVLENEEWCDPGMLYRTLRHFEQDGLVVSTWDTSGGGPARRVYHLTDAGRAYLDDWAAEIRQTRAQLDRFLTEYQAALVDPSLSHSPSIRRE